jgi:hypothetical protein
LKCLLEGYKKLANKRLTFRELESRKFENESHVTIAKSSVYLRNSKSSKLMDPVMSNVNEHEEMKIEKLKKKLLALKTEVWTPKIKRGLTFRSEKSEENQKNETKYTKKKEQETEFAW